MRKACVSGGRSSKHLTVLLIYSLAVGITARVERSASVDGCLAILRPGRLPASGLSTPPYLSRLFRSSDMLPEGIS